MLIWVDKNYPFQNKTELLVKSSKTMEFSLDFQSKDPEPQSKSDVCFDVSIEFFII